MAFDWGTFKLLINQTPFVGPLFALFDGGNNPTSAILLPVNITDSDLKDFYDSGCKSWDEYVVTKLHQVDPYEGCPMSPKSTIDSGYDAYVGSKLLDKVNAADSTTKWYVYIFWSILVIGVLWIATILYKLFKK